MKKLAALLLIGAMSLSLAACGQHGSNTDTEKEQQETQAEKKDEQPAYFKKFVATDKLVSDDNKIRELMPIVEYDELWKKLKYTVFTFDEDGIKGHVPSEENNFTISLTYDELLGVNMKDIYVIMPESCSELKDFSMLSFIAGSEDSDVLFDDFIKEHRDMTMDIGSREAIEFFLGCETTEDFLLYDYILETYGDPSEVSVQYDGDEKGYVLFAVYKMEDWSVTFALGEYGTQYRHLLIIEPVREEAGDATEETTNDATEPTKEGTVESPYKDKT